MTSAQPGPYAGIPLWLRPITRRPGEVQFGVLEGGPIVSGVSPDEARLLARLDGTLPPEDLAVVAGASGVSGRRWRVLLDLVVRLGLLEPLPASRAAARGRSARGAPGASDVPRVAGREAARTLVHVVGPATLSGDLARLLAHNAALAVVHVDEAGTAALASGGSSASTAPAHPEVVVLVADIALDPRRGDIWLARNVPHLPVVTSGTSAVVGPLVDGSSTSPCLWCLDLHRSDRDEAWPTVMAQVATVPAAMVAAASTSETAEGQHGAYATSRAVVAGLPELVAGTVAALVARCVAGDGPPRGVAVEVSLPWPRLDHRRWAPHPLCRNHRPDGTASAEATRRT